ncbi:MAG: hypothetical protein LBC11_03280 [Puniceicoccales bacterium]|nr:hypothetical protein [Puniceicoccales bacterium]
MMFPKLLVSGLLATLCLSTAGCSSLAHSHRQQLEKVYGAHDEIVKISSQLQDIQQVMLYAGRVNDSPISSMARKTPSPEIFHPLPAWNPSTTSFPEA